MVAKTLQGKSKKGQFTSIPHRKGSDTVMDAVAENLEQLTGMRGSGNKKAVLWEDLANLGLADFSKGKLRKKPDHANDGNGSGGGGDLIIDDKPAEKPTTPKNVVARSGFGVATIIWDTPIYHGHSHALVYQSRDDNYSNAIEISSTPSNILTVPIEPTGDYYYWVKFVNIKGEVSPINAVKGAHAKSTTDPQYYLDLIAKEIESNPDFIPVPDVFGGLDISDIPSALDIADIDRMVAEALIQNTATIDKQTSILKVGERTLRATLERNYYTSVKTDEVMAGIAEKLKAEIESPEGTIMSAITNSYVTKTGLDHAIASMSESLGVRFDEAEATLSTVAQVVGGDDGLQALWGVKAKIGDLDASVGLIAKSASDMSKASAQFVVRNADFRMVYDEDDSGTKRVVPVFGTIINPDWTKWDEGGREGKAPIKYILSINTASIKVAHIKDLVAGDLVADSVVAQSILEAPRIRAPIINEKGANFYVNEAGNVDMNQFVARAGSLHSRLTLNGGSYVDGRDSQYFLSSKFSNFYVTHDGYVYAKHGRFEGEILAEKIIGDLVSAGAVPISDVASNSSREIGRFKVKNNNTDDATLLISNLEFQIYVPAPQTVKDTFVSRTVTAYLTIKKNGVTVSTTSITGYAWNDGGGNRKNATEKAMMKTYMEVLEKGESATYTIHLSQNRSSGNSKANHERLIPQLFRNGSAFTV